MPASGPADPPPTAYAPRSVLHTVGSLLPYLWPEGDWNARVRVLVAALFLVLAKVATVYIPLAYSHAVDALAPAGPVCVMGFCFGGASAWLAACRCRGVAAAAAFYGVHIVDFVGETPRTPTLLHFGRRDPLIPPADIERIREAHPDLPVHVYDADHAFVAPGGDPDSARLAMLRTRAFFHRAVGGREHGA